MVVAAAPAAAGTAVRCDFDGDGTADLAIGGGGLPCAVRAEARLGMAVAMLGADLVVGIPGEAGPSTLAGGGAPTGDPTGEWLGWAIAS